MPATDTSDIWTERERELADPANRQWLYHATTSDRIPGIRSRGLLPSTQPRFQDPDLAGHSTGAVFFARTIRLALFYAHGGLIAGDIRWRVPEDGDWVPGIVALRVPWRDVYAGVGDTANPDRYARGDVRTIEAIPPSRIEAGIDGQWVPIASVSDDALPWFQAKDEEGPDAFRTLLYDKDGYLVGKDSAAAPDIAWRLAEEATPKDNPTLEGSDYAHKMHLFPVRGPINAAAALDRAVHRYVSPRTGRLTPVQAWIRKIAYELKQPLPDAVTFAATEMAMYVPANATLVPIPGRTGDTFPNRVLAEAIRAQRPDTVVVDALSRSGTAPSARERHVHGQPPVLPHEHLMVRIDNLELAEPVVLIDNVMTSGNTFEAARQALGVGQGLAFASERLDALVNSAGELFDEAVVGPFAAAQPVEAARLRWPALESRLKAATVEALAELEPPIEGSPADPASDVQGYVDVLRDQLTQHRSANRVRLYRHVSAPAGGELGLEALGTVWTVTADPPAAPAPEPVIPGVGPEIPAEDAYRVMAEVPLDSIDWLATVQDRVARAGDGDEILLVEGAPISLVHVERDPQGIAGGPEIVVDRPMMSTAGTRRRSFAAEAARILEAMSIEDALAELGLDPGASPDEVKRRRRQLALKLHPDFNPGQGDEAMKRVNDAADTLLEQGTSPRGRPSRAPGFSTQKTDWDWTYAPPRREQPRERPPWVTDPRDEWSISEDSFRDLNYCKKKIWEEASKSGSVRKMYLRAHDGYFFRGSFAVLANESVYRLMAEAMRVWNASGNPYHTEAVVVSEGDKATLIWTAKDGDLVERIPTEDFDDELHSPPALDRWMMKRLHGRSAARLAVEILRGGRRAA